MIVNVISKQDLNLAVEKFEWQRTKFDDVTVEESNVLAGENGESFPRVRSKDSCWNFRISMNTQRTDGCFGLFFAATHELDRECSLLFCDCNQCRVNTEI